MIATAVAVALALVLGWAGAAKLRAPASAPVRALALTEVTVALLLAVPATTRVGGALAAVLGAGFAVAVLRMRARAGGASRVRCGCFGDAREHPVSLLLLRAGAVAAGGLLVASGAADRDPSGGALLAMAVAVLAVAVIVLGVLVLALYRQVGVLERRLGPRAALEIPDEGPPLGQPAPDLAGLARTGAELVAFGSAGCRLCRELEPGLRALARDGVRVIGVREDADPDAFARFGVPGTPFLVHCVDGVVTAKGLVNTLEQAEELVAVGAARVAHAG